jgi:hypothetical protein
MPERRQTDLPRSKRKRKDRLRRIGRDAGAVVVLVAAIGFTAHLMHPVYAGHAPVLGDVIRTVGESPAPPAPPESLSTEPAPPPRLLSHLPPGATAQDSVRAIEASPEFADQKQKFATDLVATGRMSPSRADTVARFAVREAFLRGVPPAVIFGVMLTENAQFVSKAKSNVGAVGLMQVYPKVWLKALQGKFGSDIASDSTNFRYGVFILSNYLKPRRTANHLVSTTPGSLMTGLLHYNGCVHGTNTPRCHTYPNKVQGYVEHDAQALCGNQSFYDCIAKPFMAGLLGRTD